MLILSCGIWEILTVSGLIWLIKTLTDFPLNLPLSEVLAAIGVSCSVGTIFGVIPARQAAKLDPIEALRSE